MRSALGQLGPSAWSKLVDHTRTSGGSERGLQRALASLVRRGEVTVSRDGVYALASAAGSRVAGTVIHAAAQLWLDTGAERLVIGIGTRLRRGDRVTALAAGGTATGVRVVEPSPEPLIGLLARAGRALFVESLDPDLKGRVDLAAPPPAGAGEGSVVEVRLLEIQERSAAGRIERVRKSRGAADTAAEALLAAHRVPRAWSFDPQRLRLPKTVSAKGRKDLRTLPLVTIDGADARDFDDAVYAAPRPRGGWRLVVAIADVAHYVKPGSALDRDARERGNSAYLPDRVVPMLPEALSNGICSLVPRQDRLAVVCDMRVSARGRVSGHAFYDAVIRSHQRLTYDAVDEFRRSGTLGQADKATVPPDIAASLRALYDLYQAFATQREQRGALDLDTRESRIVLRDGDPVRVDLVQRTDAHRLIEEAMIAANVSAARHLEDRMEAAAANAPRPPPVYRVHEPPSEEKIELLRASLRIVGERLADPVTPAALLAARDRAQAKSSWPAWVWDVIVLRSLAQARYQPKRLGHFGLALSTYVHFTSPIRRYSDLLVHRAIKGAGEPLEALESAAAHISATERRAEDVERAVDAWLKCALLEDRVGETFAGTVAGVTEFGLFVELDDIFIQGLLHVSRLGRDYYLYVPEAASLVGERSGKRYSLADRVQVVVEEVSVATGRVGLVLAGAASGRRRGRRRPRG